MSRTVLVSIGLHTGLAVALSFVPLFDLLGYEFAFAQGLLAALTGLALGVGAAEAGSLTAVWARLGRDLVLVLLPALGVISANALRVRNCDYLAGLGFFLLLPVSSGAYGGVLGVALRRVLGPLGRRAPFVACTGLVVGTLIFILWRLYSEPPIFVFDHLFGYFSGSLYDEDVTVEPRLLWFRVETGLRLLAVAVVLGLYERRRFRGLGPALFATGVAFVCIVVFDHTQGPSHGFSVSRADIEAELPMRVERPEITVYLPAGTPAETAERLADDHVFRIWQLRRALGLPPGPKLRSYVYRDLAHKARLMGGRATQVAKPWLGEIHVHDTVVPHPIVAHELVHVLLAPHGRGPLSVSSRFGVLVNMGLVEGYAEAFSPERGNLDLHAYARTLADKKMSPDIRQIIGPGGFWSQAPARAYTVTGSFIRYLRDHYGAAPLLAAYGDGDFPNAFGKDLDTLVGEWQRFIDSVELSERDRGRVEERLFTSSIFERPCAHVIAALRERANRAAPAEAVRLRREICRHLGDTPSTRLELAEAMRRADDVAGFETLATTLLEERVLTLREKARLEESRAVVFFRRGDVEAARRSFRAALEASTDLDSERKLWVLLWALDLGVADATGIVDLLKADQQPLETALLLLDLVSRRPEDPTPRYLLARQYHRAGDWPRARALLEGPAHPFEPIEVERRRLLGLLALATKDYVGARLHYQAYLEMAPTSGERARARDTLDRISWLEARGRAEVAPAPPSEEPPAAGPTTAVPTPPTP